MGQEVIRVGQLEIRYLVDGAEKGGLGMFELRVPPGAVVPPAHSHAHNEECVYVLDGALRYSVDGVTRELSSGDFMSTQRGSVHAFDNPGTTVARALVILTPDIGAGYFREVAAAMGAGGPPDRTKLLEVMARYGLVLGAPARSS